MLTPPTVAELAAFTGRAAATYSPFAVTVLSQSALLFSLVTRLSEYPADPDRALLAKYAIMSMADKLYLEQPYQDKIASPFASETIGSYSYAKSSGLYQRASSGGETGLWWWDLAVDELGQADQSLVASGSVVAFERDQISYTDGVRVIESPQPEPEYFYVNANDPPRA